MPHSQAAVAWLATASPGVTASSALRSATGSGGAPRTLRRPRPGELRSPARSRAGVRPAASASGTVKTGAPDPGPLDDDAVVRHAGRGRGGWAMSPECAPAADPGPAATPRGDDTPRVVVCAGRARRVRSPDENEPPLRAVIPQR